MGAAVEDGAGGDTKKKGGENKNKDAPVAGEGPVTVVFQFDMHCAGCAKKVKRAVAGFQGVEQVSADSTSGRLTVSGHVDPDRLRGLVESKMHKRVNLVSVSGTKPAPPQPSPSPPPPATPPTAEVKQPPPQPQAQAQPAPPPAAADGAKGLKDSAAAAAADAAATGGGGEEKKAPKTEGDDKPKPTPKAPPAAPAGSTTMVIRMRLHCDECIDRLRRKILRFKGVEGVHIDGQKELVTVKGTMDAAALPAYLKEKTGRSVEVLAPPASKKGDGGGGEKKDGGDGGKAKGEKADGGGDGGEKKPKEQAQQPPPVAAATTTANKMQFRGLGGEVAYAQPAPQAFAYASYGGGGGSGGGEGSSYAYPYPSSYPSYASPPQQQQQYGYSSPYPYPPPFGADQAGPSSSISVAYPPYGSGGGYYPGASPAPPGAAGPYGYLSQAPQFFSDENPNACSVM